MTVPEIVFDPPRTLAAQIRARERSVRDVMTAFYDQIDRVNPAVNAIVALLDREQAMAAADRADSQIGTGDTPSLCGLPIAFKDVENVVGFPNTSGSRINKDNFPAADSVIVERIKSAGAIPIGKTNVPEFGLGSHSYNDVYGTTCNPWDLTKSAGGSSGGAAAALASGMLPIADGSDTGGSLRNPANFNSIVGFRTTPGLVPKCPTPLPWLPIGVKGPLGRTVSDCAFMLSVMAGFDGRDQMSFPSNPQSFADDLDSDPSGLHIAWCPDLGGLPVDARVREVIENARPIFETMGVHLEEACPDFSGAEEAFLNVRALNATTMAPLMRTHGDLMKPEAIWNIEAGLALDPESIARAMIVQNQLFERTRLFMERFDAFVCVVNQVPPFPIEQAWPSEVDGVQMEHYIDWMRSAWYVTATRLPAISVPAGFTSDGLPVGIQIVGRYHQDLALLKIAFAFEQAAGIHDLHPAIAHLPD